MSDLIMWLQIGAIVAIGVALIAWLVRHNAKVEQKNSQSPPPPPK